MPSTVTKPVSREQHEEAQYLQSVKGTPLHGLHPSVYPYRAAEAPLTHFTSKPTAKLQYFRRQILLADINGLGDDDKSALSRLALRELNGGAKDDDGSLYFKTPADDLGNFDRLNKLFLEGAPQEGAKYEWANKDRTARIAEVSAWDEFTVAKHKPETRNLATDASAANTAMSLALSRGTESPTRQGEASDLMSLPVAEQDQWLTRYEREVVDLQDFTSNKLAYEQLLSPEAIAYGMNAALTGKHDEGRFYGLPFDVDKQLMPGYVALLRESQPPQDPSGWAVLSNSYRRFVENGAAMLNELSNWQPDLPEGATQEQQRIPRYVWDNTETLQYLDAARPDYSRQPLPERILLGAVESIPFTASVLTGPGGLAFAASSLSNELYTDLVKSHGADPDKALPLALAIGSLSTGLELLQAKLGLEGGRTAKAILQTGAGRRFVAFLGAASKTYGKELLTEEVQSTIEGATPLLGEAFAEANDNLDAGDVLQQLVDSFPETAGVVGIYTGFFGGVGFVSNKIAERKSTLEKVRALNTAIEHLGTLPDGSDISALRSRVDSEPTEEGRRNIIEQAGLTRESYARRVGELDSINEEVQGLMDQAAAEVVAAVEQLVGGDAQTGVPAAEVTADSVDVAALQDFTARFAAAFPRALPVKVVQSVGELPQAVQDLAKGTTGPRAAKSEGAVWLVLDNIRSTSEAIGQIAHEQVAHVGLDLRTPVGRQAFLTDLRERLGAAGIDVDAMRQALPEYRPVVDGIRARAIESGMDEASANELADNYYTEEFLARSIEKSFNGQTLTVEEQSVIDVFLAWLRSAFGIEPGPDADRVLIEAAHELMQDLAGPTFDQEVEAARAQLPARQTASDATARQSIGGAEEPRASLEEATRLAQEMRQSATKFEDDFFEKFFPSLLRKVGNLQSAKSAKGIERAAEIAVADVMGFVRENPQYLDYYTKDWALTRALILEAFPEMQSDPDGWFAVFRTVVGMTSPSTNLPDNIVDALNVMRVWLRDGNLDAIKMGKSEKGNRVVASSPFTFRSTTGATKAYAVKILAELVQEHGLAGAVDFLQGEVTTRELHELNKRWFSGPAGNVGMIKNVVREATGQDERVPRMFIFGPKVGAYTLNALGDSRYTTTDIWEGRFIRSYFKGMLGPGKTGLPTDLDEQTLFQRFASTFNEFFKRQTGADVGESALQAVRWFYIINRSRKAGYRNARTNDSISGYVRRALGTARSDYAGGGRGDGGGAGGSEPAGGRGRSSAVDDETRLSLDERDRAPLLILSEQILQGTTPTADDVRAIVPGASDSDAALMLSKARAVAKSVLRLQEQRARGIERTPRRLRQIVDEIFGEGQVRGEFLERARATVEDSRKREREQDLRSRRGLSAEELGSLGEDFKRVAFPIPVAELRKPPAEVEESAGEKKEEGEEEEQTKAPLPPLSPDDIIAMLDAIAERIRAKLITEGVFTAKRSTWRETPEFRAEYRATLASVFGQMAVDLTYGAPRARAVEMIRKLRNRTTLPAIERDAHAILELINVSRVRETRAELLSKLRRRVAKFVGHVSRTTELEKRTIAPLQQEQVNWIKEALGTPEKAQEGRDDLSTVIDRLEFEAELMVPGEDDISVRQRQIKAEIFKVFGGLGHYTTSRNAADVAAAIDYLERVIETGTGLVDAARERRNAELTADRGALLAAMEQTVAKANTLEPENVPLDYIQGSLALKDMLYIAIRGSADAARDGADAVIDKIDRQANAAHNERDRIIEEKLSEFAVAVSEIYGVPEKHVQKQIAEMEKPRAEFQKFSDNGKVQLSRSNLLQIVGALQQEDVRQRAEKNEAWKRWLEQLPEIEKQLTPQDFAMLEWLRGAYERERALVGPVVLEITGYPVVPPNSRYLPIRAEVLGGFGERHISVPVIPKSFEARVSHSRDFDQTASVFDIYIRRVGEDAHLVSYARWNRYIRGVFAHQDVQRLVKRVGGEKFLRQLLEQLADEATNGRMSRVESEQALGRLMTVSSAIGLGLNLPSALKGFASAYPQFALELGVRRTAKYALSGLNIADPMTVETWKKILNDPLFRRRFGGTLAESVSNVNFSTFDRRNRAMANGALFFHRLGDAGPLLHIGGAIYRAAESSAEAAHMSSAERHRFAMDEVTRIVRTTQMSERQADRSAWVRRGGWAVKLLTQFQGPTLQFLSRDIRAIRELFSSPDPRVRRRAVRTVAVNHILIPLVFNGMGHIAAGILFNKWPGDDDDWSDEGAQLLASMLAGPFSGAVVFGSLFVGLVESTFGGSPYGQGQLPAAGGIYRAGLHLAGAAREAGTELWDAALGDAGSMDFDETMKELDRAFKAAAAPYRHVRQAVEGYGDN